MLALPATIYPNILQHLDMGDVARLNQVSIQIRHFTQASIPAAQRGELYKTRQLYALFVPLRRQIASLRAEVFAETRKDYPPFLKYLIASRALS